MQVESTASSSTSAANEGPISPPEAVAMPPAIKQVLESLARMESLYKPEMQYSHTIRAVLDRSRQVLESIRSKVTSYMESHRRHLEEGRDLTAYDRSSADQEFDGMVAAISAARRVQKALQTLTPVIENLETLVEGSHKRIQRWEDGSEVAFKALQQLYHIPELGVIVAWEKIAQKASYEDDMHWLATLRARLRRKLRTSKDSLSHPLIWSLVGGCHRILTRVEGRRPAPPSVRKLVIDVLSATCLFVQLASPKSPAHCPPEAAWDRLSSIIFRIGDELYYAEAVDERKFDQFKKMLREEITDTYLAPWLSSSEPPLASAQERIQEMPSLGLLTDVSALLSKVEALKKLARQLRRNSNLASLLSRSIGVIAVEVKSRIATAMQSAASRTEASNADFKSVGLIWSEELGPLYQEAVLLDQLLDELTILFREESQYSTPTAASIAQWQTSRKALARTLMPVWEDQYFSWENMSRSSFKLQTRDDDFTWLSDLLKACGAEVALDVLTKEALGDLRHIQEKLEQTPRTSWPPDDSFWDILMECATIMYLRATNFDPKSFHGFDSNRYSRTVQFVRRRLESGVCNELTAERGAKCICYDGYRGQLRSLVKSEDLSKILGFKDPEATRSLRDVVKLMETKTPTSELLSPVDIEIEDTASSLPPRTVSRTASSIRSPSRSGSYVFSFGTITQSAFGGAVRAEPARIFSFGNFSAGGTTDLPQASTSSAPSPLRAAASTMSFGTSSTNSPPKTSFIFGTISTSESPTDPKITPPKLHITQESGRSVSSAPAAVPARTNPFDIRSKHTHATTNPPLLLFGDVSALANPTSPKLTPKSAAAGWPALTFGSTTPLLLSPAPKSATLPTVTPPRSPNFKGREKVLGFDQNAMSRDAGRRPEGREPMHRSHTAPSSRTGSGFRSGNATPQTSSRLRS